MHRLPSTSGEMKELIRKIEDRCFEQLLCTLSDTHLHTGDVHTLMVF